MQKAGTSNAELHPLESTEITLDDLGREILKAQAAKKAAIQYCEKLERRVAEILGHSENGNRFDGDELSIYTSSNYHRTVDPYGHDIAVSKLGLELAARIFPLRPRLDIEAFFALRNENPVAFEHATRSVLIRELPPTVSVKAQES